MVRKRKGVLFIVGAIFILSCATVGCSPKVAPDDFISRAEIAVKTAKESDASINAPLEIRLAEDKLNRAKDAMKQEEFEKAKRLADEAMIDVKLAETKSQSETAKKVVREMDDSIKTLRQEIERLQKRNQ